MRILIAADSFKDALDSFGVCASISKGFKLAHPEFEVHSFPLADGGEGTSDILAHHLGGRKRRLLVADPLLRTIQTDYLLSADGKTAFIELAKSSGLQLLKVSERNPMFTTTFGFGEMINDAISQGVNKIILAIGGSATNDAGIGMARALGFEFLDNDDKELLGKGADLTHLSRIVGHEKNAHKLSKISFSVICDVKNPLLGPNGAAKVYAGQKGASDEEIIILNTGLQNLAKIAGKENLADTEGAGAAGGMGFGAMVFLNATLHRGIDLIMQLTQFENQIKSFDLIITGEGKIDGQTAQGKLVQGITSIAAKHHKPVIALCGTLEASPAEISSIGLQAAFSISTIPQTLELALKNTAINLESTAFNIARIVCAK